MVKLPGYWPPHMQLGGYSVVNTARAWALLTSIAVRQWEKATFSCLRTLE
jgi:hypothetical protein